MKIGYARVSTKDQNLEIQNNALTNAGCDKIFSEKKSGKSTCNRLALKEAIDFARRGDTLIVYKLDRFARSMIDLSTLMQQLSDKGVKFRSLNDSIDTTTAQGRLMLSVLGAFAEFERDLIAERSAAGRQNAKKNGIKFGRKPKITQKQIASAKLLLDSKKMPANEIAHQFGISRSSLYRLCKNHTII